MKACCISSGQDQGLEGKEARENGYKYGRPGDSHLPGRKDGKGKSTETRPWILTSRVCHPTHAPVRGCPYLSAHNSRVTLKSLWTNGSGSPVTELDKSNEHCIAFGIFGYFGPCIDPWTNWIYIRKISSWEVAQLETSRQTFIDKIYELDNSIQIILFYLPVSAASRGLKY